MVRAWPTSVGWRWYLRPAHVILDRKQAAIRYRGALSWHTCSMRHLALVQVWSWRHENDWQVDDQLPDTREMDVSSARGPYDVRLVMNDATIHLVARDPSFQASEALAERICSFARHEHPVEYKEQIIRPRPSPPM